MTSPASAQRHSGLWLVVLTLLSWASVPLFLRGFKDYGLDPYSANGWRYGISAAFWLPYLVVLHRRGKLPAPLFRAALIPTAFNIIGQTLFAWGPTLLEPGFFSFVFRVQIIFVTLGAYMLFPAERALLRTWRYWLGVSLIALGALGLFLFRDAPVEAVGGVGQKSFALGVIVSILSGVFFAGYGLSVRYFVSKYDPIASFGVICQFTALGTISIMLLLGTSMGARAMSLNAWQWFMLVSSAFIGIAISHVMYYTALQRVGVSVTAGIIQLQPILTAVGSVFLFDERLNAAQWMCGTVGIGGALLLLTAGEALRKQQATLARAQADEMQPEGS